ncbi:MAG: hypothetical protein KJ579_07075 [Verrucomicrobia bacterium]|nr:hypothetical protein [Verrucomicrobiota bacterium]
MTNMTMRAITIGLALMATGCGVTTRTTLQRGSDRTSVSVEQEKWGMHLLEPALYGVSIEFPSALLDRPGVIPASSLDIHGIGRYPWLGTDTQSPWAGYINCDVRHRELDIRLYGRRVSVYGSEYFPPHPLNGVHRVNSLTEER